MTDLNKQMPIDLGSLARSYTKECIKQVSGILINDPDNGRRLTAAAILLDRGWGKPRQDSTQEVKGELQITIRKLLGDALEAEDAAIAEIENKD